MNRRIARVVGTKALLLGWLAVAVAGCGLSGSGSRANALPTTADAGADQVVDERASATLSGTGSDSDGTIRSNEWSQTAGARVQPGRTAQGLAGSAK